MAKRNERNQNPDRAPSGNNPTRRRDNANQGTEGGRSSSRKPGTERPDTELDRSPGNSQNTVERQQDKR